MAGQSRTFIIGESPASTTAPHTQVYLETFSVNGYTFAIIASTSDLKPLNKEKMPDYQVAQGMIQSLSLSAALAHSPNAPLPAAPAAPSQGACRGR